MSQNQKSFYVGNAQIKNLNGQVDPAFKIQLDLSMLWKFLKEEKSELDPAKYSWTDKTGFEHKTIKLVAFPLKEENKNDYRTHSLKIDLFVPEKKNEQNPETPQTETKDDLPF